MAEIGSHPLRWGILGPGAIARRFAEGLAHTSSGILQATASRDVSRAAAFADEFGGAAVEGYSTLLSDPNIDAIYIATPHPHHVRWTILAAEAGKHVLVEKPIALNHAEAMAAVQAARRAGTFLMEAFMYRPHPQTYRLIELIREGVIGEVRLIEARFGFRARLDTPQDALRRTFANELGGGGILDVGCYPVSMARLIAGAALGRAFANPIASSAGVTGAGTLGETGIDEWATATLTFEGGIVAQLQTAVRVPLRNDVVITGTEGRLELPEPWFGMGNAGPVDGRIDLVRPNGERESIAVPNDRWLYAIEADEVAAHIEDGEAPSMSLDDTLGNMITLDRWRRAIGLVYEAERPETAGASTFAGRPLRRQVVPPEASQLPLADIAGLPLPLSRLVLGCDHQVTMPHAEAMWDDYFERGGNVFDTAHLYTGGVTETLLGTWLRARGVRDEVALIVKGAHTPNCNPEAFSSQLEESLERLQIDTADLYFLHRDDPAIPIGEWVEVLNEHVRRGQIRVFGGSNWTIERIEQANAYADEHELQGFGAVSNNFSLARMERPVWPGVLACSDDRFREWLVLRQLPDFSWSSQARGFFTDRGASERAGEDPELTHAWFSDANHERRRRAIELGAERGVEAVNIALAYALHQPFPTFCLVGPRTLAEWDSTVGAIEIDLKQREIEWLDLRRDER